MLQGFAGATRGTDFATDKREMSTYASKGQSAPQEFAETWHESAIQTITEVRTALAETAVQLSKLENRLSTLTNDLMVSAPLAPTFESSKDRELERPSELVSVADLVKELRISRSTLYNLKSQSDFPKPIRFLSRRTVFRRSEVLHWLENQRRYD